MPLTPATTDKFMKVGLPGTATTLAAPGFTDGVTTAINVVSTSNWSTDTLVAFAMDAVTVTAGVAVRTPGTYCEFVGIVTSATTIGSLVRRYGTGQNYTAGSLTRIYIPVSSTRENDLIDGLNQDHNGKGNHKTLTDDNGNEWLERGQVASAVNQIKVTNAIINKKPIISSSGDDTNSAPSLQGKGTGLADVDGAVPKAFFALFDFVEPGGVVITADSVGVNKNYSISAGFIWIGGKRLTVAAVSAVTVGASQDRYIDLHDNGDGTAVYVTQEVNNNVGTGSPALAAGNVRIGIVVAGATTIAAATSINQGQPDRVLPIVSSIAYTTTDSLGNLIYPTDPARKTIGYRQLIAAPASSTNNTATQVVGLSVPVIIPAGRKAVIRVVIPDFSVNAKTTHVAGVWDGVVGGTQVMQHDTPTLETAGNFGSSNFTTQPIQPSLTVPTSKTYNVSTRNTASQTVSYSGAATNPLYIAVELV